MSIGDGNMDSNVYRTINVSDKMAQSQDNSVSNDAEVLRIKNGNNAASQKGIRLPLFIEFIISLVERILSAGANVTVRTVVKVGASIVCVLGFLGVAGGIEAGKISLAIGLLYGALITVIEILTLRNWD